MAWKLRTVTGYSDKQWCTDSHWLLYFGFCCLLCNGWVEELIHLFASCVVWGQNLLLLHILNVLAWLEPFADKMCHFDHECHSFSLCGNCWKCTRHAWIHLLCTCCTDLFDEEWNNKCFSSMSVHLQIFLCMWTTWRILYNMNYFSIMAKLKMRVLLCPTVCS